MTLSPCPRKQGCPNNNILLLDSNAIIDLVKIELPKRIDHTYRLREYFVNFLSEYNSLLERVFGCSIDGKNLITGKIFEEIDMINSKSPLRKLNVLRTICENLSDYRKMNEVHRSAFLVEEIDEPDLKKLRAIFPRITEKVSDQDLSLAVLALRKTQEMDSYSVVIITNDERLRYFLGYLRDEMQIELSFGTTNCSRLAYRHLTEYLTEIYRCCKMEKEEYEIIYHRLCEIYYDRTDVVDRQIEMLKRNDLWKFTGNFTKITMDKYPSQFEPRPHI